MLMLLGGCATSQESDVVEIKQQTQPQQQQPREKPVTLRFLIASEAQDTTFTQPIKFRNRSYYAMPKAIADERDVVDTKAITLRNGRPALHVTFSEVAGDHIVGQTSANLGRYIAITINGEPASVPKISSAVGREAHITGGFSMEQVQQWSDAMQRAIASR